jgi:hypothetical protein
VELHGYLATRCGGEIDQRVEREARNPPAEPIVDARLRDAAMP